MLDTVRKRKYLRQSDDSSAIAMYRILAVIWFCVCLFCIAQAQVPMTGAGLGVPSGGSPPPSYTGPGDVVSGAVAWWGLRAYNGAYAASLGKIANICTPLDAVCADVNSDASGNFNLSGTGSLLCNNSTSICTIKIFYDQSGATNCTTACDLSQSTIATRATLTTGCLGSLVCATFTTSTSYVNGGLIGTFAQPNTWALFANNTHVSYASVGESGAGNNQVGFNTTANMTLCYAGGGTPGVTAADGSYHAEQCILDGATTITYVDGAQTTGLVTGSNSISSSLGMGAPGNGFQGTMTEVGVWNLAFSTPQQSGMDSNIRGYW